MFNYNILSTLLPEEILIYLRKSRADDPLLSVEEVLLKHETILDEWCEKNLGGKIPVENRYKEVVSGESIEDRDEFQAILKMIESPKIKAVLVVEIQRLGRPDLEEIGRITKIFRYTRTMVLTPQKTYDLQDEYDRDTFERELKRGNEYLEYQKKIMSRGRLLSVSQGNYIGSVPPYGYNKIWVTEGKVKYPTLAENKEQADVVRLIFDMYVNKDMGRNVICNYLDGLHIPPPRGKHWSPAALKDMLQNVHYIGKVKWNWRKVITIVEDSEIVKTRPKSKMGDFLIYDGKHSAIISEEIFNMSLEKIGRNHRAKPNTKVRNPFASLIRCQCGRAMTLRFHRKQGVETAPPRLVCDGQTHCGTGSCYYTEMIDGVCNILEQTIIDFKAKIKNDSSDSIALHNKMIKNLEKKLADLEKKELAQWDAQTDPNREDKMPPEIFKQLNAKLLREKDEVRQALAQAYDSMPKPVDYQEKIVKLQDALNALQDDDMNAEEKNKLLKACIEKIEYHRDRPQRMSRQLAEEQGYTLGERASWVSPPIELEVKLRV